MPDQGRMIDEGEMKKVGRQIKLPWSKAAEIAAKSLKVRFGRSLVTMASIVLAIAFLMSILTGTTLITSLKTEPPRRIIALRERLAKAQRGEDIGLTFPEGVLIGSVRNNIRDLQAQLADRGTSSLDRRLVQAELGAAQATLEVLQANGPNKEAKARTSAGPLQAWRVLQARADLVAAENEWRLLVRRLHNEGYTNVKPEVRTAQPRLSFLKMLTRQMDPKDRWLALLASLVCFVGIMNAMLMSVHERVHEIGTMKCLGALESFIVKLYFLESSFVGMVGTLMGILVGFVLSMLRAASAFGFGPIFKYFDFEGALLSALGTLLIGSALSVGAAIVPAVSAARKDPVEAMRVEE